MRALTLTQPAADLLATGDLHVLTRLTRLPLEVGERLLIVSGRSRQATPLHTCTTDCHHPASSLMGAVTFAEVHNAFTTAGGLRCCQRRNAPSHHPCSDQATWPAVDTAQHHLFTAPARLPEPVPILLPGRTLLWEFPDRELPASGDLRTLITGAHHE